jgi:signal transduction histidine kinase
VQAFGYATSHDLKRAVILSKRVEAEAIPEGCPYIRIADWTNLTGTSRKAREHYIRYMKDSKRPLELILYGLSPMFRVAMHLGKRIYKVNFDVRIASDYSEAVKLAQKVLSKSQSKAGNDPTKAESRPPEISDKERSPHEITANPDWYFQTRDFSLRYEIIYGNVLHAISTGKFKEEYLEPCFKMQEKIASSLRFSTHPFYFVLCLQESKGTSQKARKSYIKALTEFHKKYPFKMAIFYGVNRFLKAAINLNKPFVPFKVRMAEDLEDALTLINKDKSESKSPMPGHTEKYPDITSGKPDKTDQHVNELLQFIEKIEWGKNDTDQNMSIDPSHPFACVFDAITLVKWELDDLIIEKTRTEEKLKQAKGRAESANRAKSAFLANMGHEFRTPLNHVIGFTELVVDKNFGELNEVQEEYLNDVLHSGRHLLSLINDILDFSKVEAGKLDLETSDVDLRTLLENSLTMIKEKAMKHGIKLLINMDGIPETIRADERKFKQIMYNLLSNAVKFTPDGGSITLAAKLGTGYSVVAHEDGDEQTSTHYQTPNCDRNFVEISIKDTGIGLKGDDPERIFNSFEQIENLATRKYQGTGLGLSLTKQLVELHGGRIWVESEGEGKGSIFSFIIPV